MKLSKKLKKKHTTIYQMVASEFNTSDRFVGQIARGERKALRGKGYHIKIRLQELAN